MLQPNPKETTEKYGLEAGLWQVFRNKDPVTGKSKGQQAKDLLKRYGGAYLITSISFAVVSFAACYALVSAGIFLPHLPSYHLFKTITMLADNVLMMYMRKAARQPLFASNGIVSCACMI